MLQYKIKRKIVLSHPFHKHLPETLKHSVDFYQEQSIENFNLSALKTKVLYCIIFAKIITKVPVFTSALINCIMSIFDVFDIR